MHSIILKVGILPGNIQKLSLFWNYVISFARIHFSTTTKIPDIRPIIQLFRILSGPCARIFDIQYIPYSNISSDIQRFRKFYQFIAVYWTIYPKNIEWSVYPASRYPVLVLTRYTTSGRVPDIWPNIRPNIWLNMNPYTWVDSRLYQRPDILTYWQCWERLCFVYFVSKDVTRI